MFLCFFHTTALTVAPLSANTDDYTALSTVKVDAGETIGQLAVTIKNNAGDIDFECFQIAMDSTDEGALDVCQTTTTICIKDEITSE